MVDGNDDGDLDPRGLAMVVVIAALMVLAIGAGMLLTHRGDTGQDGARVPVGTPAPTTGARQLSTTPRPVAGIPVPQAPPVDLANRRIGDDCSSNSVVAQWDLTPYAGWVCVPRG